MNNQERSYIEEASTNAFYLLARNLYGTILEIILVSCYINNNVIYLKPIVSYVIIFTCCCTYACYHKLRP